MNHRRNVGKSDCRARREHNVVPAHPGNAGGEQFGYDRTYRVLKTACVERMQAEEVIDHLIFAMNDFVGDAAQTDDMTCVVVKIVGKGDDNAA